MLYIVVKLILTAALVVAISEIAKRLPLMAGLLASLPLTSLLALVWLYVDTRDAQAVSALSWGTLMLLPPSFVFLAALPLGIKWGLPVPASLLTAIALTGAAYWLWLQGMAALGVKI